MAEGDTAGNADGGLAGRVDELERRLKAAEESNKATAMRAELNARMLRAIAHSNGHLGEVLQELLAG